MDVFRKLFQCTLLYHASRGKVWGKSISKSQCKQIKTAVTSISALYFFFFFFFLAFWITMFWCRVLCCALLAGLELSGPDWPQICGSACASASWMLGIQVLVTKPSSALWNKDSFAFAGMFLNTLQHSRKWVASVSHLDLKAYSIE